MTATTLFNARVYTMDAGHPHASGLVIEDGLITRLIDSDDHSSPSGTGRIIDLAGMVVIPGLIDSHLHLRKYAEMLDKVNCETSTKSECLARVRDQVHSTPPGEWVLGHGWNHNIWPDGFGTRTDLDQISQDHPIYLTGKSLHISWANSTAFQAAGISSGTPDPDGGKLGRDPGGSLNGILFEEAVKLIENHIPDPTPEELARSIQKAQENLWQLGICGVHDFDRLLCLDALQLLDERGQLKLRVVKSIPAAYLPTALELGLRTGSGSDRLWYGGVKDFMDGALGPQTAAMFAPYQGGNSTGMLLKSEQEIYEMGCRAADGGLALAIHAIGDLANRTLLNAYQRLRKYEMEQGLSPLPHRIEHLQLIDPRDIPRLAELEVTASMQPIHATSDMNMADKYWGERTQYAYAPKLQLDQRASVIFGSDAPVEDPNPWWGIHAAVTRQRRDSSPGPDGWHPEGRIPVDQALQAFSSTPGKLGGRGKLQGKLLPGYWADLIALDQDPFHCPANELADILPRRTMLAGEWVWEDFE